MNEYPKVIWECQTTLRGTEKSYNRLVATKKEDSNSLTFCFEGSRKVNAMVEPVWELSQNPLLNAIAEGCDDSDLTFAGRLHEIATAILREMEAWESRK